MNQADVRLPGSTQPACSAVTEAAWRHLHQAACAPYRAVGRFAWHFSQGKLGRDPVFRRLLERGELSGATRVVDIGCGQGLLASLLAAIDQAQAQGRWPADWPNVPRGVSYLGIELMPKDVARAQAAVGPLPNQPRFVCADMRQADLPACDRVVILDVLHYVNHAEQEAVLQRVCQALAPHGRLLLRVGDASATGGYAVSQWVDRLVTWVRGHRVPPTYGRPLAQWVSLLQALGFGVQAVPMSQGTPFANVLLVAQVQAAPVQEAAP
jgi:SAM-dependent methyltransferase